MASSKGAEIVVSDEDRSRINRTARQVTAYVNLLRWASNFKKDELLRHPSHEQVLMLSPMQSGRFSFAIEGETLLIGVQPFEAAWMCFMPFDCAFVSDRLYLMIEGTDCLGTNIKPMALGIFVDSGKKRQLMSLAKKIQCVLVDVKDGRVAAVRTQRSALFDLKPGDVVSQMATGAASKRKQQDMERFF